MTYQSIGPMKISFAAAAGIFFVFGATALAQPAENVAQKSEPVIAQPLETSAKPEAVAVKGGSDTISLDFKDADINTVLRVLSMKSGVNIVAGPDVKGVVTVRLDNVPWEKALEVILRTYDYVFERDGNIIRVTTRDKMKLEPVQTKTFLLNYSKADEIQKAIQDILTERGRVKIAERTNTLVVTDIPSNLYKIGEVIKNLDKVTPQAYIDSKIVKTDVSNTEKLGIKWTPQVTATGAKRPTTLPFTSSDGGNPAWMQQFFPVTSAATGVNPVNPRAFPTIEAKSSTSNPFTYGTLDFSAFSAVLNMLETRVNTKIISNPRIVVLNNMPALIQVGEEIPIPSFERNETTGSMEVTGFNYRNTGVVLNVTPHINSAEEILVDLTPEVSAVGVNQTFGTDQIQAPRFTTTKAKTQVLIQSGQTIAVGGLLSDKTGIEEDKVPYLGDIPFVGKLFRSKTPSSSTEPSTQKVETLFFVTVTMVDSAGQPAGEKVADQNQAAGDSDAAQVPDKNAPSPSPEPTPQPVTPQPEGEKSPAV